MSIDDIRIKYNVNDKEVLKNLINRKTYSWY